MLQIWGMITHYLMVSLRTHHFQGHLQYHRLPLFLHQVNQLLPPQHNLNQHQLLSQLLNLRLRLHLHPPSRLHSLLLRHNQQLLQQLLLQHPQHKLILLHNNQLQRLNHSQPQPQQRLRNQQQGHQPNHPHKQHSLLLRLSQLINPNLQTNQNPQHGQLVYLRQTQRYLHSTKGGETKETQPFTGSFLSIWKSSTSPRQCSDR